MLSLTVPKFPSKVAATPGTAFQGTSKPTTPNAAHSAPLAPAVKLDPSATKSWTPKLTQPLRTGYTPDVVHETLSGPTAQKEAPVASFIGRHLPGLSGRAGAGLGALAGGVLGALDPGTDSDGDRKSRLGGALGGALTGAALGGVAGSIGRRAIINPAMKRLSTNAGVHADIAAARAADAAKLKPQTAAEPVQHAASLYGIGHQDVTQQHINNAAKYTAALPNDPHAALSFEGLHPSHADQHASITKALANPEQNSHVDAAHGLIQKHITTDADADAAISKAHAAIGMGGGPEAAAPTMGQAAQSVTDQVKALEELNGGTPQPAAGSKDLAKLKQLQAASAQHGPQTAAVRPPAGTAPTPVERPVAPAAEPAAPAAPAPAGGNTLEAKQKYLAQLSSIAAQHGRSDIVALATKLRLTHEGLGQLAAQHHATSQAPAAKAPVGPQMTPDQDAHVSALESHKATGGLVSSGPNLFSYRHAEFDPTSKQWLAHGTTIDPKTMKAVHSDPVPLSSLGVPRPPSNLVAPTPAGVNQVPHQVPTPGGQPRGRRTRKGSPNPPKGNPVPPAAGAPNQVAQGPATLPQLYGQPLPPTP